jgi:hypothetical protein
MKSLVSIFSGIPIAISWKRVNFDEIQSFLLLSTLERCQCLRVPRQGKTNAMLLLRELLVSADGNNKMLRQPLR